MVAISPVRRLGRAVRGRTAGLAASADLPVFLGRVLYHLVVDIIVRRKYVRTLAKQVSDITVGVGALVIGGGMIFVIATMSLATGADKAVFSYATESRHAQTSHRLLPARPLRQQAGGSRTRTRPPSGAAAA
ncbi:hypothetical protein OHR68_04630 [Spirillospora sp. NBC_00431]